MKNKPNMCRTNVLGGKHNCECNGNPSKCYYGEVRPGSKKICKFVMFVNHNVAGGSPVCKSKDARAEEKRWVKNKVIGHKNKL